MRIIEQKNRNCQMNIKFDQDTYDSIAKATQEQQLSVVVRKLMMIWLTNETLQKKVRLSTIQSLHEMEDGDK